MIIQSKHTANKHTFKLITVSNERINISPSRWLSWHPTYLTYWGQEVQLMGQCGRSAISTLGKIQGFHRVQCVLSCLLQLVQGNLGELGIYNMPKEFFCWQQMGLGLKNYPNMSRMSFPIKEMLWYFQEELALALHPCLQQEVQNASLGLGLLTRTILMHVWYLSQCCPFSHLTEERGVSNQRIPPVTHQGQHSQCSEAHPCQPHLTHGIATNIGSQLLVSSAARHCLLTSCISLPASNRNPQPYPCQVCSCQAHDSPMWVIHGVLSAINQMLKIFKVPPKPDHCMALSLDSLQN